MNKIILQGILQDKTPSHNINGVPYSKAKLITTNSNNKQSVINLVFKTNSSKNVNDNDEITIVGNVRTRRVDGHIQVFVFTYFDAPEENDLDKINTFIIDGSIISNNGLREFSNSTVNNQFTLKNSINNLNNYLPCISWNGLARCTANLDNTERRFFGELRSREYVKHLDDTNIEYRVAHELIITNVEEISND